MRNVISGQVHHTVTLGSAGYGSELTVTSTGVVLPHADGATGVSVSSSVSGGSILNQGLIHGARGYSQAGTGIDLEAACRVMNSGTVAGGTGEYGVGVYAGNGGIGIIQTGGVLLNSGSIYGGNGGANGSDTGGNGGTGVRQDAAGVIMNSGIIAGGSGGYGFATSGRGGEGVNLASGGKLVNSGTVEGRSSPGHYGGVGVDLATNSTVIKEGLIKGAVYYDAVQFGGAGDLLRLEQGSSVQGALGGFQAGDTIDARTISADSLSFMSGTLTLSGAHGAHLTLVFDGDYSPSDFAIHSDGHGGTSIIYAGGDAVRPETTVMAPGGGSLVHEHEQLAGPADAFLHHFVG